MEQIILRNGDLAFTARACGPADGPVVLLLHGFPDNPQTFDGQLRALSAAGYRAIAPTMRGYEPSSQPADRDYRIGTMARDVVAWVDHIGADRVHLVGHDWGAAVILVAGTLASERVHSLTTLAMPFTGRIRRAMWRSPIVFWGGSHRFWYMSFFQLRFLADWAVERKDWALLRRLWSKWSPDLVLSEAEWASRRATFEEPGVKKVMLSYYRQNVNLGIALGLVRSEALKLKEIPVRTLAMVGRDDGCLDTRLFDATFCDDDFPAGLERIRMDAAGHFMHLDQPELVNRALLDWIAVSHH